MIKQLGKNKYRLILSVGSGSARRKLTRTVTCNGIKEAKRLFQAFEDECKEFSPNSDITIEELLNNHIEFTKTLGRKATTIYGYNVIAERYESRFKSIKAKDCTPYHIEKEISRMSRKSLSAKTIKNTIGLLSAAYEHAIRSKQLADNPCKYVTLPQDNPREIRILYRDEIQDFLNALADVDLNEKVAYELALFMGLRRSEILGLKESDIDIMNGMLYVHNTRHRVDGQDIDQDTKTKRSTRMLAMPDILIADIARLLEVHRNFKYEKVDYLIQDGYGNVLI